MAYMRSMVNLFPYTIVHKEKLGYVATSGASAVSGIGFRKTFKTTVIQTVSNCQIWLSNCHITERTVKYW